MARRKSFRKWIQRAFGGKRRRSRRRGALHRQLGIPAGRKIPMARLRRAARRPGLIGYRARLALTLRRITRRRRRHHGRSR